MIDFNMEKFMLGIPAVTYSGEIRYFIGINLFGARDYPQAITTDVSGDIHYVPLNRDLAPDEESKWVGRLVGMAIKECSDEHTIIHIQSDVLSEYVGVSLFEINRLAATYRRPSNITALCDRPTIKSLLDRKIISPTFISIVESAAYQELQFTQPSKADSPEPCIKSMVKRYEYLMNIDGGAF
jgi:hypothetical protein